jgi:hypothetical protein
MRGAFAGRTKLAARLRFELAAGLHANSIDIAGMNFAFE